MDCGLFVPIPTYPLGAILSCSVLLVSNTIGSAVMILNLKAVFPVPFPHFDKECVLSWMWLSLRSREIRNSAFPAES